MWIDFWRYYQTTTKAFTVIGGVMEILAYILSSLSLLMSILLLIQLKVNLYGLILFIPKLGAGALSLYWAIIGAVGAILGGISGAYGAVPMGLVGASVMVWYVWRCARDHKGFDYAFGADWRARIPPDGASNMLKSRWTCFSKMEASPKPSFERDIVFWTVPDTKRELLCDIWQPSDGNASGLAFIYLHGGGWTLFDKDFLTRPFFRHLVSQGHTVMDVSYRLCPEVDFFGMIGDIKHAIAWMKGNADQYGVNPEKIFLAGGSAGGHLALLAGYTPEHPELTPEDITNVDLSVRGVISYYGPVDLLAMYQRQVLNSPEIEDQSLRSISPDSTLSKRDSGQVDILLGGRPQDIPDMYQLFSPLSHVHPDCPPTLLIHGKQDLLIPAASTSALYSKMVETGVPAVNILFPFTDHGFDLMVPQVNPASQSALYDVDRFLALLLNKNREP
jgi:acetyl esterase/lipase